jgi:hypothetical protein
MRQPLSSRWALLAAGFLLAATGVWAGGDDDASGDTPVIRWSGYYEFNPNATSETLVMKWLGEATGTIIEPVNVAQADRGTWWQTTLASQDFPEIMRAGWNEMGDDPNIYGPQGLFVAIDVERAAGNMPNLDRVYKAIDIDATQIFAPDGHVYIANFAVTCCNNARTPGYNLRGPLLRAAGYDTNNPDLFPDVELLEQAILDMKPHYDALFGEPTTGMHTRGDRGIRNSGQLPRVLLKDEFSADTAMQMDPDNVWRFGPLNARFKRGLEFLRTMHENGILHPDYLTMAEQDQRRLDWDEAKTMFMWGMWAISIEPKIYERYCTGGTGGESFCGTDSYPVVAPDVLGQKVWARQNALGRPRSIVSAQSDHVAKSVEVLDFMYSDEGSTLYMFGPEGYAWEFDSTPGNQWNRRWTLCWSGSYPKVECEENDPDRSKTRGEMLGENPMAHTRGPTDTWGMDWTDYYLDPQDPDGRKAARKEVLQWWADEAAAGVYSLPAAPSFGFEPDELDEKAQLEQQLHTYVDEQIARFINGQNNMSSDYTAFIDRVNTLGASRLEQIYNTAMNRFLTGAGITL